MLFSKSKTINNDLRIVTLNRSPIDRVSEYQYLGIWLDDKLTFKHHISELTTKLRQKIDLLYRNKVNFPLICQKRVVEAVCIRLWRCHLYHPCPYHPFTLRHCLSLCTQIYHRCKLSHSPLLSL